MFIKNIILIVKRPIEFGIYRFWAVVLLCFTSYESYGQSLIGEYNKVERIIEKETLHQNSQPLDKNKITESVMQVDSSQKYPYNSLSTNNLFFLKKQNGYFPFVKNYDSINIINRKDIIGNHISMNDAVYLNLMYRNTAIFGFYLQSQNINFEINLIANRYETLNPTMQFGVSNSLQYRLSPHWSIGIWGTIYNSNPYFYMATFPFVDTSSYGGWVKYEDNRIGIKLGSRNYYDSFQRQWKWEPIITPSVKIGKKIILEVPVGPMVQKSMERILKKNRNNGPVIIPVFN